MASDAVKDASEWSGTETKTIELKYTSREFTPERLFRWVNGLDVEVSVDVNLTDDLDTNNNRTVDSVDYTLSAGSHENDTLSEQWDKVVVDVTPTSQPGSGAIKIIQME
jgi:hypothetical protein